MYDAAVSHTLNYLHQKSWYTTQILPFRCWYGEFHKDIKFKSSATLLYGVYLWQPPKPITMGLKLFQIHTCIIIQQQILRRYVRHL